MSILEKITPGEWKENGSKHDTWIYADVPTIQGNIICDAPINHPESMKSWEHNKKAICAIPEMLSILEELHIDLRNSGYDDNSVFGKHFIKINDLLNKLNK
jgi:hypothetical protein